MTPATIVCDALLTAPKKTCELPSFHRAVAAFGEFWSVFTALRKEGK